MIHTITESEIGPHLKSGSIRHITIVPGFEFDYIRSIKKINTQEEVTWEWISKFKRPAFLKDDYILISLYEAVEGLVIDYCILWKERESQLDKIL